MEIRRGGGVESIPHTSWIFQTPYHLGLSNGFLGEKMVILQDGTLKI